VLRFGQGVPLSSQAVPWTGRLDSHHGDHRGLPGGPQTCLVVHLVRLTVHPVHLTVNLDRQSVTLGRLTVALVSQNPAP
jgi:hypothetical protein